MTWDLHHLQDKPVLRNEYKGKYIINKITDKTDKEFSSTTLHRKRGLGLCLMFIFGGILAFGDFVIQKYLTHKYEENPYWER